MISGNSTEAASAVHSFDTESARALGSPKRHRRNSGVKKIREFSRRESRGVRFIFPIIVPGLACSGPYFVMFLAPQGSHKSCWGSAMGVSEAAEKGEVG